MSETTEYDSAHRDCGDKQQTAILLSRNSRRLQHQLALFCSYHRCRCLWCLRLCAKDWQCVTALLNNPVSAMKAPCLAAMKAAELRGHREATERPRRRGCLRCLFIAPAPFPEWSHVTADGGEVQAPHSQLQTAEVQQRVRT